MRSGQGNPDEARSARYILKDYVNGKLLFCHPPPGISEASFNEPSNKNALLRAAGKKRAPTTRVGKDSDTFIRPNIAVPADGEMPMTGIKSTMFDQEFFQRNSNLLHSRPFVQESGKEFTRGKSYPHQNSVADDGTPIHLRKARLIALLQNAETSKKHKKTKRVKQRSGKGYD
jgi:large subunit GTPase 1